MGGSLERFAAGEPGIEGVPVSDAFFVNHPAQVYHSTVADTGKVNQAHFNVFDFAADFFQLVEPGLDRFHAVYNLGSHDFALHIIAITAGVGGVWVWACGGGDGDPEAAGGE